MNELWAITCYFNPVRYERRLANYRRFREHLSVPLLTVELCYDGRFDLDDGAADVMLQLPGTDVMWQKERLLNVAVAALPPECTKVAWLDCDVICPREDWSERTRRLLDDVPLAQLFRQAHYLDRDDVPVRTRPSVVAGVAAGLSPDESLTHPSPQQRPGTYSCGLAWAARRGLLAEHGMYDANIIGGGDRAIVCAAYGCFDHEIEWHALSAPQQRAYLDWATPFQQAVGGAVAHLDADIHHLWHGDVHHRGFGARHEGFAAFEFDPQVDIAVDGHGCWRWNSDKPELHAYVRDYFATRTEDG